MARGGGVQFVFVGDNAAEWIMQDAQATDGERSAENS